MNKIFYIMGKSASGKDKIYKNLMKNPELKLRNLVLYTTRPIRAQEEDGKQYYFVDEKRLHEFQKNGKIIESRSYDTIHGIWTYFTADDGQINLEAASYLAIGTLESFEKMKDYFGENVVEPIYIESDDGERLRRAMKREEKETHPKYEEICRRFLADAKDFSQENIDHAGISKKFQNVDLQECIDEIENWIKSIILF